MPRHPLIAVTGFMQTLTILGVYFTYLQNFRFSKNKIVPSTDPPRVVGPDGLEPSTPRLSSACSNQLSYEPLVEVPLWPIWWSRQDSNLRHPACKAGALPTELRPPSKVVGL